MLAQFQDLLYAQDRWALLLIFQAMDAAGKEEQKKRFLQRLENPDTNWKFSANDIRERTYRDDHMNAFEDTIRHTEAEPAPWYVVPADNKWFTRVVVAAAVVESLLSWLSAFQGLVSDSTYLRKHLSPKVFISPGVHLSRPWLSNLPGHAFPEEAAAAGSPQRPGRRSACGRRRRWVILPGHG